jgi:hypothetical protein
MHFLVLLARFQFCSGNLNNCTVRVNRWKQRERGVLLLRGRGPTRQQYSNEHELFPSSPGLVPILRKVSLSDYRGHGPLYSSSIRSNQQDFLLYTQFSCTPSSISSSIYSIHCGTHLSLYLNISMCDLVLKDLLRRI